MFVNSFSAPDYPKLRQKWGKWLQGIESDSKCDLTAVMLENQQTNNGGDKQGEFCYMIK